MNADVTEKPDVDALLKGWPAIPPKGDGGEGDAERLWDARADVIVKAAEAAASASAPSAETLDALVAAPELEPEYGEPGVVVAAPREVKMSEAGAKIEDPKTEPTAASEQGPVSVPPVSIGGERRRPSLKDIAARAQASNAGRASVPSSPGTGRASIPSSPGGPPSGPSGPASVPPTSGESRASSPGLSVVSQRSASIAPAPRPSEAGKDDSGMINLAAVQSSATPAQIEAAAKAKPGQADLFEEEATSESAHSPADKVAPKKVSPVSIVAAPAAPKSNAGPIAGVVIALIGMAAAFAIVQRKPPPAAAPIAVQEAPKASPVATPTPSATATAAPAPSAEATAVAAADLPAASAAADPSKPGEAARRVPGPMPVAAGTPATTATAAAAATVAAKDDPSKAAGAGKTGDLQQEMAKAVGPIDKSNAVVPTAEPAAGPRNQNIPEQPSQGSVQAAMGAVMPSAKGCVAGAEDVTRALVTFNSTGAVSSVSVSGWGASHGQSACIQGALKAAKVGPFSKPSYQFGVNIRP
jgi:hypothetical protein